MFFFLEHPLNASPDIKTQLITSLQLGRWKIYWKIVKKFVFVHFKFNYVTQKKRKLGTSITTKSKKGKRSKQSTTWETKKRTKKGKANKFFEGKDLTGCKGIPLLNTQNNIKEDEKSQIVFSTQMFCVEGLTYWTHQVQPSADHLPTTFNL